MTGLTKGDDHTHTAISHNKLVCNNCTITYLYGISAGNKKAT